VNTAALLQELETRGARFEVKDGRVRYFAPPGVLTPAIIEELSARKQELLTLLASSPPPGFADARDLVAAWRGAVRELSDIAGYPELAFKPGHAVAPGAASWGAFIQRASVPHLRLVVLALRDLIATMPRPSAST
jgi:hypothetical protein